MFIFIGTYNPDYLLFSFACLGHDPETQLLNYLGGIYVLRLFLNPSMLDSVNSAVYSMDAIIGAQHRAFQGAVNVNSIRFGQSLGFKPGRHSRLKCGDL
jgi:hypothetical protein